MRRDVEIDAGGVRLRGWLSLPESSAAARDWFVEHLRPDPRPFREE